MSGLSLRTLLFSSLNWFGSFHFTSSLFLIFHFADPNTRNDDRVEKEKHCRPKEDVKRHVVVRSDALSSPWACFSCEMTENLVEKKERDQCAYSGGRIP